jgi:outer membrane protein TolC
VKVRHNLKPFANLKKSLSVFFFIQLLYYMGFEAVAQIGQPGDSLFFISTPSDFKLPSLDSLIQAALSNSGGYQYFVQDMKVKKEELKLQNKDWYDYVSVDGDVGYGHNDQFMLNQYSYDIEYSLLSNSKQVKYYAGLSLKVPFSALMNRGNNLRIAHYNVSKAEGETKKFQEQISSNVIELYFKIMSNYKMMTIGRSQMESSQMELEKAEKEFIDGKLSFNSYSVSLRNYYRQEIDFEISKNDFMQELKKLELITGLKLTKDNR